jgi:phospholipid/cholesterol/gamma-HCH transport system ATP-binding protein
MEQLRKEDVIIRVRGLVTAFGPKVIHDHLELDVKRGEILGLVGGSGSGKSLLLNTIIGLRQQTSGTVEVFGQEIGFAEGADMRQLEMRWGVLFQEGALFSSMTVAENIQVPLREYTGMDQQLMDEIAAMKIALVGLPEDSGQKYPSELSGGMKKRAGLARALALDPELVFLDEPTSGLDPISANMFDELIKSLSESLGLTVVMVTHDLDSLRAVATRVAVLVEKKIKSGTIAQLREDENDWIQDYFSGPRGRAALDEA